MKKIYFEPEMLTRIYDMQVYMQNPSINSDLPNPPGEGSGDDDDEWGNAKERGGWDRDGLW